MIIFEYKPVIPERSDRISKKRTDVLGGPKITGDSELTRAEREIEAKFTLPHANPL